jgi:hypothetical protein
MTGALQGFSAPRFSIQTDGVTIPLTELNGITSHVEKHEYIYNDDKGATIHTKQFGKINPPTVSVTSPLDTQTFAKMMTWHEAARSGKIEARKDVTLTFLTPDGNAQSVYTLEAAWLSKLEVTSAKAGASDTLQVKLTLECDKIVATGVPTTVK